MRKSYTVKVFLGFVILINSVYLFGCISLKPIYYEDDKKIAENLIKDFHAKYNNAQFEDIYQMYKSKIKNEQSKEQFISALQTLKNEMGNVVTTENIKSDIKPNASYRTFHSFYKTKFEKGVRFEEFDCLVDGKTGVINYYGQPEKVE